MEKEQYIIVTIGAKHVGKSMIEFRVMQDTFLDEPFENTGICGMPYQKQMHIDERYVYVQIDEFDTFECVDNFLDYESNFHENDNILLSGNAYLLIYDLSVSQSVSYLYEKVAKMEKVLSKPINELPLILLGNKCDLQNIEFFGICQKSKDCITAKYIGETIESIFEISTIATIIMEFILHCDMSFLWYRNPHCRNCFQEAFTNTKANANKLQQKYGIKHHWECSAKEKIRCKEAIHHIFRMLRGTDKPKQKRKCVIS